MINKVDMARRYMKDDIEYSIILLRRVMGFPTAGHLAPFMVNFIETIKHAKMPLDWATTLNKNLCDELQMEKDKKKFYMTSYVVYLLAVREKNYP